MHNCIYSVTILYYGEIGIFSSRGCEGEWGGGENNDKNSGKNVAWKLVTEYMAPFSLIDRAQPVREGGGGDEA
jgi:hypothetical protein